MYYFHGGCSGYRMQNAEDTFDGTLFTLYVF